MTTSMSTSTTTARRPLDRADGLTLGGLALAKLLLHLPVLGRYGFHHDELYFLACGRHLAAGYVDHPPFVPWVARLADELFGGSLVGLRLFPLLAGTAAVVATALLARRLGGGRFAQLAAGGALLVAPVFLRPSNLLCIPAFEPLVWLAGCHLVVRILDEGRPRWWLGVGVVAGVGLLVKHTMLLFGFGLVAGLLLSRERRQLLSPWLWAGGGVAALVALPNLLWQIAHDWPTVEFVRNVHAGTMSGISGGQFLLGQVFYPNPVTAPLWLAGLVFFLYLERGRPWRLFGWMWLGIFVLLLVIKSKIYYLAPAYPVLLAGGGVAFEELVDRLGAAWLRPATAIAFTVGGLLLLPLSLPYLSIDATERWVRTVTLGRFENVYELTGDLRGQMGWKERVDRLAEVYHSLPETAGVPILTSWYGPAGAIDHFGPAHGLPRAYSSHMSYYYWGPPEPFTTAVVADVPRERLDELFEDVEVVANVEIDAAGPGDRYFPIAICRRPKVDFRELWPEVRRFGH